MNVARLRVAALIAVCALTACSGAKDGSTSLVTSGESNSATTAHAGGPATTNPATAESVTPDSPSASSPGDEPKSLSDLLVGSEEERLDEQRRIGELVVRCMSDMGRPYIAPPPKIAEARPITDGLNRFDVYQYPQFVQSYGYGIATLIPVVGLDDPNNEYLRGLSLEQRTAYVTDLDGCSATARGAVIPATRVSPDKVELVMVLDQMLLDARRDPAVERGVEAWSSCMAAAGYSYRDPESLTDDLRARREAVESYSASLAAFEMTVSAIDLQCYDTHLRAIYDPVRERAEETFLEKNGTKFFG